MPDLITRPGSNRSGYSSELHWPRNFSNVTDVVEKYPEELVGGLGWWPPTSCCSHDREPASLHSSLCELGGQVRCCSASLGPSFLNCKMGVTMVITIQEVEDQPATMANIWLCPACRWHLAVLMPHQCLSSKSNPFGIVPTQKCKFTYNTLKLLFNFNIILKKNPCSMNLS